MKLDHARRRPDNATIKREISLSRHYVRHADESHIRDTILHEIAHALVGPVMAMTPSGAARPVRSAVRQPAAILEFRHGALDHAMPERMFETGRHRRKAGLVCASCRAPVEFVRREPVGD